MATRYWLGKATAVAQEWRASINVYDGATTYKVTIGGVTVSVVGTTDEQTTTDALVTALNASTHPYFAAITWSRVGSAGSSELKALAKVAGCPFEFSVSVTGGTGSWNALTYTTACTGPYHWDNAENWSGGAVPVAADTVIIESGSNICWGLAQSAVDLDLLIIRQTYTGKIGLRRTEFATSADGATYSTTSKAEYRQTYLDIESDAVSIGEHFEPGTPAGSGRIKLDLGVHQTTVTVFNTARQPTDSGLPAVRLLIDNVSSKVLVRGAPGGVGIAVDEPTETSTVDTVSIADATSDTRVHVGRGTTIEYFVQRGGVAVLEAAATVTDVTLKGGSLALEGPYLVTTVNVDGGELEANNTGSGAAAITTLNIDGGSVVATRSPAPRTWTTTNWRWKDADLDLDPDVVTLTNKVNLVA